jgi:hypothetical protein
MHNPQNQKSSPVQTLRKIIVNIRDPVTIASIRAMSPRSLKSHIDHAIEQSNNEPIEKIKVVSSNQLKSGDLSIKTATTTDMIALRQFAEDWEQRIGNGATVRIPTYGVLVHGVRTSSMDMDNFEPIRDGILQDNKPFIPNAEIKYIGWLTRSSSTKSASSVVVEFSRPEDANKVIDEGLVWQGEVFQCELYDRQCSVRQCFQRHKYGHIGTQCKATITCGYCAQEHATRDCPTKSGWMAYGKGYRQKMGGQPSTRWSDDGEAVFHMGEHISIEDFTRTLRNEVMETQRLLDKLFGEVWQTVSQKIDMGRIAERKAP